VGSLRREKAEGPEEVEFQAKPDIALDQIRAAVAEKVARGVVLADAAYGINTEFRDGITDPLLRGSWVNQVRKARENARKPA